MKLPNGDQATVSDQKLLGYLLNPEHPHGASKAYLFRTLLGIDRTNAETLRLALLDAARDREATPGRESPHGHKYEVRFPLSGPRGEYTVKSVWILSDDDPRPRFVTALVE